MPAGPVQLWEVCCSPQSALTQGVLRNHRAERLTLPEWDFAAECTGHRAKVFLKRSLPQRVWISIPCTAVSNMQQLAKKTKRWKRSLRGKLHSTRIMLRNVLRIARQQLRGRRLMYFEWPAFSRGWQLRSLRRFEEWARRQGIALHRVRIDGCQYGLRSLDNKSFLKKPWTILTNDAGFCALSRTCSVEHRRVYRHAPIQGSRQTEQTAYYPPELVSAVLHLWRLG